MISIKWLIFSIFTLIFVIGMLIHLLMESYYTFGGSKGRWELGFWGLVQIVGYCVFLGIYGGIYWW